MDSFKKILLFLIYFTTLLNGQDAKIIWSNEHGIYENPFELTITSDNPNAILKFTLDCSDPSKSLTARTTNLPANIKIDPEDLTGRFTSPAVVVRAALYLNDTLASKIETQTFLFLNKIIELSPHDQVPGTGWLAPGSSQQDINYGLDPDVYNNPLYSDLIDDAFKQIPIISLVTELKNLFDPDSGIYVNPFYHGIEWERFSSVELIDPKGLEEGFSANCGIRIRGGYSRNYDNPKRAFRLFFRGEYGDSKLKYPLFGDEGTDTFDKIDLRTAMNYSWSFYGDPNNTFLRDVFSRDTQRDMSEPYTRSRYYHLFLDGVYFGLYQTQERSEASYAETYFGGSKEDYDVIKVDIGPFFNLYQIEATDGTLDAWKTLWTACNQDLSKDELYMRLQGLNPDGTRNPDYIKYLDVDNLIDYMIITFFVGDFDGPISAFSGNTRPNNFYAIFNRNNPDGFKFFRHDAEHSLFLHEWSIDRTGPYSAGEQFEYSNPQWIHQQLMQNKNYRLRFADRVQKHLFNNGALTLENCLKRLEEREAQIDTAIIAESARWGDSKTLFPRTKLDWENAVKFIKEEFFPGRAEVIIQQLRQKQLYTYLAAPVFNKYGGTVEKGFNLTMSSAGNQKIYYTLNGEDPHVIASTGDYFNTEVIPAEATKSFYIPNSSIDEKWNTEFDFDETGWHSTSGLPGGIGYDLSSDYLPFISYDVQSEMYGAGKNTSCFIRIKFDLPPESFGNIKSLILSVNYDDGFVAYLNGAKVASSNSPSDLAWNSNATANHEAGEFEDFDLVGHINLLKEKDNLLAIHALNVSLTSSDFLILPKLTITGNSSDGISPNAIEYSSPVTINKTTTVKARVYTGSDWSPLTEATFNVKEDLSNLRITELHYHPLDEDTISGKYYEFIEMKNTGDSELILTGSKFTNGIDFTFDQFTLPPKAFVVIASDTQRFKERYGFGADGQFNGQLNNGGERITFVNSVGDTVFNFKYSDNPPWPQEADGLGNSLSAWATNPYGNPDDPSYWRASAEIHGSPGKDDPVSSIEDDNYSISTFKLYQNYPNPFNPTTTIKYTVPGTGRNSKSSLQIVNLTVFDVLGRKVAVLVNKKVSPGNYKVKFDGENLSSGIYFYSLRIGNFMATKKMLLLK